MQNFSGVDVESMSVTNWLYASVLIFLC